MQDRRTRDRRDLGSRSPHFTRFNREKVIFLERRRMPDRRLNNIQSEFIPLEEFYK
jgi:hypothetical protein